MDSKPRCFVYIDGFNLYYGVVKKHPEWKWLDIGKFFKSLRPFQDVFVRYFTAIIEDDPLRRERQLKYLEALGTLSQFDIIRGKFQLRISQCRAGCGEEFQEPKEKKTDVNIAVRMIHDCINDTPEAIILVSSDSDLEPAIAWIHRYYPKVEIMVYLPNLPDDPDPRRNDFYRSIGVECTDLPCGRIPDCQFQTIVKIESLKFVKEPETKVVQRPEEWAKNPTP
jgi:hypothetical protein